MASLLILSEESRRRAQEVKDFALTHPISLDRMERIREGLEPPVGDDHRYAASFDRGYRVVYTVEQYPLKDGTGACWFQHISISLMSRDPEKYVAPQPAVVELMGLFGIETPLTDCFVYWEEQVRPRAMSIIAPL